MRRRLLNLLTLLSLLLCVAAVALWVRSRVIVDEVYFLRPAQTAGRPVYDVWRVGSTRGRVAMTYYRSSGRQDMSEPSLWANAGDWGPHWKSYRWANDIGRLNPGGWHAARPGYQRLVNPYARCNMYRKKQRQPGPVHRVGVSGAPG